MLEGIEILSQTEITTMPTGVKTICLALIILMVLSLILSVIFEKDWICNFGFGFGILGLTCFIIGLCNPEHAGKFEYKVTIDENVSMLEFYEHYEIISVEDKIYTIRIKE